MMWSDVVIGSGSKGCSAIHVFAIEGEHNVSENNVSYWVARCYLGMGMTIFKDTPEGKALKGMIEAKCGREEIQEWLCGLLLDRVPKETLKVAIDKALAEAFGSGRAEKAAEMRAVLGL